MSNENHITKSVWRRVGVKELSLEEKRQKVCQQYEEEPILYQSFINYETKYNVKFYQLLSFNFDFALQSYDAKDYDMENFEIYTHCIEALKTYRNENVWDDLVDDEIPRQIKFPCHPNIVQEFKTFLDNIKHQTSARFNPLNFHYQGLEKYNGQTYLGQDYQDMSYHWDSISFNCDYLPMSLDLLQSLEDFYQLLQRNVMTLVQKKRQDELDQKRKIFLKVQKENEYQAWKTQKLSEDPEYFSRPSEYARGFLQIINHESVYLTAQPKINF